MSIEECTYEVRQRAKLSRRESQSTEVPDNSRFASALSISLPSKPAERTLLYHLPTFKRSPVFATWPPVRNVTATLSAHHLGFLNSNIQRSKLKFASFTVAFSSILRPFHRDLPLPPTKPTATIVLLSLPPSIQMCHT